MFWANTYNIFKIIFGDDQSQINVWGGNDRPTDHKTNGTPRTSADPLTTPPSRHVGSGNADGGGGLGYSAFTKFRFADYYSLLLHKPLLNYQISLLNLC